jgi:uncharacterized membrane protein
MWYKFEEGKLLGTPRIKEYQVAWYDMENDGRCFDESFYKPEEIDKIITYVETIEDEDNCDRSRVFVHFNDGEEYELKLVRIENGRRCDKFYS